MNFARLNHVLIPATKEGRDRQRNRVWVQWLLGPMARGYFALSDLGRGLSAFTLVASLMGLDVMRGQNYAVFAATFSLLAASIWVRRFFRADAVSIEIEAPPRAFADEPVPFRVRLHNAGPGDLAALRVRRPFLPWDGSWLPGRQTLAELTAGDTTRLECEATFSARGRHHLDSFGVAALVPLGLAVGPEIESRGTRFIVWPRPLHVPNLEPHAWLSEVSGRHLEAGFAGASDELIGLRPYRPGDAVRDLHAPTWARTGEPMVREYDSLRSRRITLFVDTDASNEAAFELALRVVAGLLLKLADEEVELGVFVLEPGAEPRPLGCGRGVVDPGLDVLACVQGRAAAFDAEAAAQGVRSLSRGGDAIWVTPRWDEARAAFAGQLAETGGALRVIALEPPRRRFVARKESAAPPASPPGVRLHRLDASTLRTADRAATRGRGR